MGLKFVEHKGGKDMYYCASCCIYLADREELVSTNFTGSTGRAYMFRSVCNLKMGPIIKREMITGFHFVRDVFCMHCNKNLGWIYELASNDNEKYKEGQIILERLRIMRIHEHLTTAQIEELVRPRDPNYLEAFRQVREERQRILQRQQEDRILNVDGAFRRADPYNPPFIVLHDEQHIVEEFEFDEAQMNQLRDDVRHLNDAIRRATMNNTHDLWTMGYREDIARQYTSLSQIMNGQPFRPSREADEDLVHLFDGMHRERERVGFHMLRQFDQINGVPEAILIANRRAQRIAAEELEADRRRQQEAMDAFQGLAMDDFPVPQEQAALEPLLRR